MANYIRLWNIRMDTWCPQISPRFIATKTHPMTSSNGSIFHVSCPWSGKSTGHQWISPHKGQWRGASMPSLICAWTSGWANNRKAGDLRRHRVHYDVIVVVNDPMDALITPLDITKWNEAEIVRKFASVVHTVYFSPAQPSRRITVVNIFILGHKMGWQFYDSDCQSK